MDELTIGAIPIQTMRDVLEERITGVQNWLLQRQLSEGCWKGSPWHTAKIIMTLIDTGVDPNYPKFKVAYKWLIDNREQASPSEVNWEGWTWDTALVVRCLKRLKFPDTEKYISQAIRWMRIRERRDIEAPTMASYFGRCYTAQVVMALVECGVDVKDQDLLFFIHTLQQQQEPDGGWITSFDTAQIVEALVKANVERNWIVQQRGEAYEGGLDRAVKWFEKKQNRFGNWDGLTWPTAWALRAYLLTAQNYNPKVVTLALVWLLEQQASKNPSWFHEQGRSATAMLTLKVALDCLSRKKDPNLDPDMRRTLFYLGFEKFSRDEETRIEESEETKSRKTIMDLSLKVEELSNKLQKREDEILRVSQERSLIESQLKKIKSRIWIVAESVGAVVFFALAVVGYIYASNLAGYILGAFGTLLAILSAYEGWKNRK